MMDRKSCMAVAIALANKMARQSWTMLQGKGALCKADPDRLDERGVNDRPPPGGPFGLLVH